MDAPDFVSVVLGKPEKAGKLAEMINQAAWIAPEVAAERAQAISAGRLKLERAEREREEQIKAVESRLQATRQSFEPPGPESSGSEAAHSCCARSLLCPNTNGISCPCPGRPTRRVGVFQEPRGLSYLWPRGPR